MHADRMPVILGNKDSVDLWLNKAIAKVETVLTPYEDADLVLFFICKLTYPMSHLFDLVIFL